jgi:hypothetical protein
LLFFTCDIALLWLMADSDKRVAKRLCYRTGLGRKAEEDGFPSKINKSTKNWWGCDRPTVVAVRVVGKSEAEIGTVAILLVDTKKPYGPVGP